MTAQIRQKEEFKRRIVDFSIQGVENFLKEHPDLEFNVFLFACNTSESSIDLFFNTELEFRNTLKGFQEEFSCQNVSNQEIRDLKYGISHCPYYYPDTFYLFGDEEFDDLFMSLCGYKDDESFWAAEGAGTIDTSLWEEYLRNLLELFTESLLEFTKTEAYEKIPKTKDFAAYCINVGEDVEQAIDRLNSITKKNDLQKNASR